MTETSGHVNPNANANLCSIKVGTTGTIGSLMARELELLKHKKEGSGSSSGKKGRTTQFLVPCGASPRILQSKRDTPVEPSHGGSNKSNKNHDSNIYRSPLDGRKPRQVPPNDQNKEPILSADNTTLGRNKLEDKSNKKVSYIVEVVDLKCNNPMNDRLRKLGFSKLSESVI